MFSQKLRQNDKSYVVNNRIIEPLKDDVFMVGPGQMATPLTKNVSNGVKVSNRKKRKHTDSQSDYQSLDEMLAEPNQNSNFTSTDGVINGIGSNMPTTGNLVNTLVQGLQSHNEQMLCTVLDRQDSFLIRDTVHNLPNDMVEEFIKKLHKLFFTKGDRLIHYYIWLTTLLQEKLSVILMSHNAQQELASLKQLFVTRCDIFDRMCALNGRLSLMSSLLEPSDKDKELSTIKAVHYHESSEEEGENNAQDADENSSEQDREDRELERIVVMDLSDSEKNSQEEDGDDEDNEDEIDVDVGNEDANDNNDEDVNEVDTNDEGDDEDDDSD